MHKLLLDENLSPWVGRELQQEGRDVVHVRERGILGDPDHVVLARAYDEDRILVTANVGDFRKLAVACDLHAGIVLVEDGGLSRVEQLEVVRRVVETMDAEADLINRVLTVRLDGELIIEELPP